MIDRGEMKGKPAHRYKTGTKRCVMILACTYAIRDQESLIDAYEEDKPFGEDHNPITRGAIKDAEDLIADLKHLQATIRAT